VTGNPLPDRFHTGNVIRIAFLEQSFDNTAQSHLSARATCAMALQPDSYNFVGGILDKLDVPTVSLKERSDLFQSCFDFVFDHFDTPLIIWVISSLIYHVQFHAFLWQRVTWLGAQVRQ
jgi:hypothetical protein